MYLFFFKNVYTAYSEITLDIGYFGEEVKRKEVSQSKKVNEPLINSITLKRYTLFKGNEQDIIKFTVFDQEIVDFDTTRIFYYASVYNNFFRDTPQDCSFIFKTYETKTCFDRLKTISQTNFGGFIRNHTNLTSFEIFTFDKKESKELCDVFISFILLFICENPSFLTLESAELHDLIENLREQVSVTSGLQLKEVNLELMELNLIELRNIFNFHILKDQDQIASLYYDYLHSQVDLLFIKGIILSHFNYINYIEVFLIHTLCIISHICNVNFDFNNLPLMNRNNCALIQRCLVLEIFGDVGLNNHSIVKFVGYGDFYTMELSFFIDKNNKKLLLGCEQFKDLYHKKMVIKLSIETEERSFSKDVEVTDVLNNIKKLDAIK